MAKEDASVAINNALQKIDQQPNLFHKEEKLKSLKSNLHNLESRLDRINSIPKLTEVREVAYDAEDTVDDAIKVAAQKRWRKMGNSILFFSQTRQKHVCWQIDDIEKRTRCIAEDGDGEEQTEAVDDNCTEPSSEHGEEIVEEESMPPGKDVAAHRNLLYLSLSGFPAGVEVSARKLIQIWAAEGFLVPQGSIAIEEQGREQIKWLIEKEFITQAQVGTCGNIKSFKIEQEKLNECILAAEKEDFLHVKIVDTAGENKRETSKLKASIRLSVHSQTTNLLMGSNLRTIVTGPTKLRSLQIHCSNSSPRVWDCRFLKTPAFDSLKVLDLGMGCLELETIPEAIGEIEHLRYLRLRAPRATRFPASICRLDNLQTIDLKETTRVKTMPVEIWKMKTNLRHLHLGDGATSLLPPRRANHYNALQNLQTLCGVRPDKQLKRLMVRAKFPNVNRLRLQCTSESDLSFLNSLDLLSDLRSLTLRGPIKDLPTDWNAFPSSMTKMTLSKTMIKADKCMGTLEKLPNLRYLKLMEDSMTGEEMKWTAGRFPALLQLRMTGLKELKSWTVEKGAMRLLEGMVVCKCESLTKVKAIQPSKKLREMLDALEREHANMTVEVPPPPESNGGTTMESNYRQLPICQ